MILCLWIGISLTSFTAALFCISHSKLSKMEKKKQQQKPPTTFTTHTSVISWTFHFSQTTGCFSLSAVQASVKRLSDTQRGNCKKVYKEKPVGTDQFSTFC